MGGFFLTSESLMARFQYAHLPWHARRLGDTLPELITKTPYNSKMNESLKTPKPLDSLEKYWRDLAVRKDWTALLSATALPQPLNMVIGSSLWRARVLRILGDGEAANKALLDATYSPYQAPAAQVAELAEELLQCAYYEAAVNIAKQLQAANAPQADYLWAMIWREYEDWSKCALALERLKQAGGDWIHLAQLQEAWALIRQGRFAPAAVVLASYSQAPNPGIQKLLARLEVASGKYEIAVKRLEGVAQQQPLDWEWPPLLAAALAPQLASTDTKRLFQLYEQGLQRQPRQAEALMNRARLFYLLGSQTQAESDTKAALAIKPWFDAPVLLWAQDALSQGNPGRAEQLLKDARQQYETPRRAAAMLDVLRFVGNKRPVIVAAAEKLLAKFPDDIHVLRTVGAALQSVKLRDRAAQCYRKALEIAPDDAGTRNNLALLCRDRGDLDEAVATWRQSLADADDTVRLNFAHTLLLRGDKHEAKAIFLDVLHSQPHHPVALRGMAEISHAAGEDERAWDYAQRSLAADPGHPLAWKVAAAVARRWDSEARAIELLEQGESQAKPVLALRQALFQCWRHLLPAADLRERLWVWCNTQPDEVEYWLMAADAAHDENDFERCEQLLREAYEREPSDGGTALVRFYLGRAREGAARKVAEQLVQTDPHTMRHWGLLAEVLYRQERVKEALEALDCGLKKEPSRLSLVRQKVGILLAQENFSEAVLTSRALVALESRPPQLALLTEALQRAQRNSEAVEVLEAALVGQPDNQLLRFMHASALRRAGRLEDELTALADLYRDEPDNFNVVQCYVRRLAAADHLSEAVVVLQKLINKSGAAPDLLVAVVSLLREQGLTLEARNILRQGLLAHPRYLGLWEQGAAIEKRLGDEAAEVEVWRHILESFPARRWAGFAIPSLVRLGLIDPMQTALNAWRTSEPANVEPWWAAFHAAQEMKQNALALDLLDKIEAKRGAQPEVHAARANLYQDAWRMSDAQQEIRKAIELRPDSIAYRESLFSILVKAGDFKEVDELMARLEHLLGDRRYDGFANFFFNINCHPTWSAAEVWRFYKEWYERAIKPRLSPPKAHTNVPDPKRRLRIGYLSPDFRRHAVAYFSEPLLIKHDRDQFELFAYAHLDVGQADEYTDRFKTYFHHWTETRGMSDDELERKIREDQIDILVDLAGHTANNRLPLMMRRPAPVQASWIWGAGQTTGLPQVDYFLTDSASVPAEHDIYMAERVMRMTRPGLPFNPAHDALEPTPLPCLVNGFITFGVLARPLRTNRQTVALWSKVMQRIPNAILRFDHVPYAEIDVQERLIGYFAEHGIGAERLQFKNTRPHWQVYQEIDVQLDPFPAGSGTTATEGLFMERLVVTLKARPPMGLIAHGQLQAMGLDMLCTADNESDYVEKTLALVSDFQRLAKLSKGLRDRVQKSWLMDYHGYSKEVANLYRQMWISWCDLQASSASSQRVEGAVK